MILNSYIMETIVRQHRLPTLTIRQPIYDTLKAGAASKYSGGGYPKLHCWPEGDLGLFRIGIAVDGYNVPVQSCWAQPHTGGVGEIGWAENPHGDGQRHVVWRTAYSYPAHGCDADDNQPWRLASSIREAVALLLASMYSHISTEMGGLRYRKVMSMEETWYNSPHDIIAKEITRRNIARLVRFDTPRQYYDPTQDRFVQSYATKVTRHWHCKSFEIIKDMANGEMCGWRTTPACCRFRWTHVPPHCFVVAMEHHTGLLDMAFGDRVPEYVRHALRETRGRMRYIPAKPKHPEDYRHRLQSWSPGGNQHDWDMAPGIDAYAWGDAPQWLDDDDINTMGMSESAP